MPVLAAQRGIIHLMRRCGFLGGQGEIGAGVCVMVIDGAVHIIMAAYLIL